MHITTPGANTSFQLLGRLVHTTTVYRFAINNFPRLRTVGAYTGMCY